MAVGATPRASAVSCAPGACGAGAGGPGRGPATPDDGEGVAGARLRGPTESEYDRRPVRATNDERPGTRDRRFAADWIHGVLEARPVRLVLSAAIVASLLPASERIAPAGWFAALFGVEFAARVYVHWDRRRRGRTRPGGWATSLLVLDFLALVSFAPIPDAWGEARWLRLFRLSRMLLLAGYWAPLARDLWVVVSRRERWQQVLWMGGTVGIMSFAGATLIHHLGADAVDFDGDGVVTAQDRRFFALLWWSFRQIQDPGNMLASPASIVALVVSFGLTVFGLFLVSFLIGLGTDVVRELVELGRTRPPGLSGHTVIVHADARVELLLRELFGFYRKSEGLRRAFRSPASLRHLWDGLSGTVAPDFVVAGADEEEPPFLKRRDFARVVYRAVTEREQDFLERVDGHRARRLLLLADHARADPDARTVETLFFLASALDEAHDPDDRKRLVLAEILDEAHLAAAAGAVARMRSVRGLAVPTERLLGLFWSCLLREPGAGRLLTELLSSHGREIYTVIFDATALSFRTPRPAWLPADARTAFAPFVARGLSVTSRSVVPLALLCGPQDDESYGGWTVYFGGADPVPTDPVRGVVVVADNVAGARALVEDGARAPVSAPAPSFEWDLRPRAPGPIPAGATVVVGFREGTAHLVADVLRADPSRRVLVLVEDAAAAGRARRRLEAHALACSLSRAQHESGVFEVRDDDVAYVCGRGRGTVHVHVAPVLDAAQLSDLPGGFGSVCEAPAVVFVADPNGRADARTVSALFQILGLARHRRWSPPRLLVEVSEVELARRLSGELARRYPDVAGRVEVHAFDELRSLFLFQSVIVPGFDAIYTTILSARGRRLRRLAPPVLGGERATFEDLVRAGDARGIRVLAVDLYDPLQPQGTCTRVAPRRGDPGFVLDQGSLAAVWAVVPAGPSEDASAPTSSAT